MLEFVDSVEALDDVLPLAEYLYGTDVGYRFLLEDMTFDNVLVTGATYESL